MRIRTIALSLAALFTLTAAAPARADEVADGKALVSVGVISSVGSLASGLACGLLINSALGDALGERNRGSTVGPEPIIATCSLNLGLGAAGIAMTVVGAKKMRSGRELQYSLNGLAGRF